ncbi:MAG TPA: dienelactone hydrolase family protein [Acidimicrobiales bacterium]|nr:dienelactone hydrolase family protein [Acidimicrobiales bacterium]
MADRHLGDDVEFPGGGGSGYLATAGEGAGLGVIVIHEIWGVAPHIRDVCDRFAAEGFTALAPDLFDGRTVSPGDTDEALKMVAELDMSHAAAVLSRAVDYLAGHDAVRGDGVGVVGFCIGGGMALWLATLRPDMVKAAVPFYGLRPRDVEPDWSKMQAAVEGHYAELDERNTPAAANELAERLTDLGLDVRMFVYPGTKHAFFNDSRDDAYDEDAARQAWIRTLEFLRAKLG